MSNIKYKIKEYKRKSSMLVIDYLPPIRPLKTFSKTWFLARMAGRLMKLFTHAVSIQLSHSGSK